MGDSEPAQVPDGRLDNVLQLVNQLARMASGVQYIFPR